MIFGLMVITSFQNKLQYLKKMFVIEEKVLNRFLVGIFSLEFDSVKQCESFLLIWVLDRYVFEIMKKALVGDNLGSIIKKGLDKKNQKGQ